MPEISSVCRPLTCSPLGAFVGLLTPSVFLIYSLIGTIAASRPADVISDPDMTAESLTKTSRSKVFPFSFSFSSCFSSSFSFLLALLLLLPEPILPPSSCCPSSRFLTPNVPRSILVSLNVVSKIPSPLLPPQEPDGELLRHPSQNRLINFAFLAPSISILCPPSALLHTNAA